MIINHRAARCFRDHVVVDQRVPAPDATDMPMPAKALRITFPSNTRNPTTTILRRLPERAAYEIRYPVVEGYAFDLRHNAIKANVAGMERLAIEPEHEPTAVFVQAQVGYRVGPPSVGPAEFVEHDRAEYYASNHLQTSNSRSPALVGQRPGEYGPPGEPKLRLQSRHRLFPQVLRSSWNTSKPKVDFRGVNECELGLEKYVQRIVGRL